MERQKLSFSWNRKIEYIIILLLSAIVAVSVIAVMLFIYEPNHNALGALATVCMDVLCLMILMIMIISLAFETAEDDKTTRLFLALMVATMFAMFFDFLTWSFDGSLAYADWTYVWTVTSLCSASLVAAVFVCYLSSYLEEIYGLESVRVHAKICVICNLVAFVVAVILAISKNAFFFSDGHYETGALYDVVTVLPVLTLIYMTVFSIRYFKVIGMHDLLAVVGYIVLMLCGTLIETLFRIGTTYVSVALADIFIYVMLQNKFIDRVTRQIDEEKKNVQKWIHKSNTDELTGFLNRHAYEDEMTVLKKKILDENFVYVSADVNGLKVVNDSLGHEAGDELIIGACECMRKCFGAYGNLYRTGGDEFVALIYIDDEKLKEVKKQLEEITANWHGKYNDHLAISCGYVTQRQADRLSIHQIAILADKKMYEAKTKYYLKAGIDRRGQRDAHVALCSQYCKILKINVTRDTFQIISLDEEEQTKEKGYSEVLSAWMHDFALSGQIHPDDLEMYLEKINLGYIRGYFKNHKSSLWILYRRKYGDEYKKTVMEIIPANDYENYEQNLFLYVKNLER